MTNTNIVSVGPDKIIKDMFSTSHSMPDLNEVNNWKLESVKEEKDKYVYTLSRDLEVPESSDKSLKLDENFEMMWAYSTNELKYHGENRGVFTARINSSTKMWIFGILESGLDGY